MTKKKGATKHQVYRQTRTFNVAKVGNRPQHVYDSGMHDSFPLFIAISMIIFLGILTFLFFYSGSVDIAAVPWPAENNVAVVQESVPVQVQEVVVESQSVEIEDPWDDSEIVLESDQDYDDNDLAGATNIEDAVAADEPKEPVKAVKSAKDGNKYYVSSRLGEDSKALGFLEDLQDVASKVLTEVKKKLDAGETLIAHDKSNITKNMEVLIQRHYQKPFTLAEYIHFRNRIVGANSDKGLLIEICLRSKYDTKQFNSQNTVRRVFLHEMAHSADFDYREKGRKAHGPEFEKLHMYLLGVAEDLGLYSCELYNKHGDSFCGLALGESYCRD